MRSIKEIRLRYSEDYARATRQVMGMKAGEVVRIHIENKWVLCMHCPTYDNHNLGCRGCIFYKLDKDCTRWVGSSTDCRLIPVEDIVE